AVCGSVALINQISFRRNGSPAAYAAIVRNNTTVLLGTTTVSPATMSTTFASNLGTGPMTTLVNGVNFNLPALPAPTGLAPLSTGPMTALVNGVNFHPPALPAPTGRAPFSIHYPPTPPYLFLNAPGKPLLMEWIVPGVANSKQDHPLHAETRTGGSGYARPFG